jgi:hypothetical protein
LKLVSALTGSFIPPTFHSFFERNWRGLHPYSTLLEAEITVTVATKRKEKKERQPSLEEKQGNCATIAHASQHHDLTEI